MKIETFMKNAKKLSKYALNTLAIVNALLIGLDPIWSIPFADKIIATISVVMAVMSTYLLGDKAVTKVVTKGGDNK